VTLDKATGGQDGEELADGNDTTAEDERLMGELRTAAAHCDPPPSHLTELLGGLLTWRDPDAELAELAADSRQLAGSVRAGPADILVRFEASRLRVTFEAGPDISGQFRLVGQVEPGEAGEVTVVRAGSPEGAGETTVQCDQAGRFEVYPVGAGPVSLRLTMASGATVRTAWTVLK
jgi:hypothetical protein